MIIYRHISMNLKQLSVVLVGVFIFVSILLLFVIYFLGGLSLLVYLRTSLIQGLGLGIALTALLFFVMRIVWRLHAVQISFSLAFVLLGAIMFTSVSMGRLYSLQYPIFVNSFGPGEGPGLPARNVLAFFKNFKNFPVIADIARDPNDVPPPITVLDETPVIEVGTSSDSVLTSEMSDVSATSTAENMLAMAGMPTDVLAPVTEQAMPDMGRAVVKVYLETTEVLSEIAPGITYNYWTFNNTVPGPMVRIKQGDIVEVTIYNKETNLHHHNVDFHAATGPGGGGAVSIVNPGETKTFRFKALSPGLFVYHCAVPNMAVHMAHGMYGMILVEPTEGLPKVDKEFYIMQGELYTVGAIGRTGLQIFDAQKMMDGNPSYMTFNGRTAGLAGKMEAKVGDKIRMFVGNGGVSHNSSFHIVGEIFDTVYPEASIGGALFKNVQTTNVPAGGATIVEFTVNYPGNYVLVDHALMRADKGAWGVLKVTGEADKTIFDGDFIVSEGHTGH